MKDNKCVKFILETTSAFESIKDHDHETSLHELHHQDEDDHIIQSLNHFLHLTTKAENCVEIAQKGGLDILLNIYKNYAKDNFDVKMILSKIITNMSSADVIDYLFQSGWIWVMSQWQDDEDLRIQVFASTFLNNLDKYDKHKFIYKPKLYPLYPRGKVNQKSDLDLVFVHGLLGGIWITWRVQRDSDMIAFGGNGSNGSGKDETEFYEDNLKNSFFQEEAVFRNEKIVQMEPTTTSKILTITEQTTTNVLNALNEMAEEKLSLEDVSNELNLQ
jgi:hypothetical protein